MKCLDTEDGTSAPIFCDTETEAWWLADFYVFSITTAIVQSREPSSVCWCDAQVSDKSTELRSWPVGQMEDYEMTQAENLNIIYVLLDI